MKIQASLYEIKFSGEVKSELFEQFERPDTHNMMSLVLSAFPYPC